MSHNCGKFDASYVTIAPQEAGGWLLSLNDDPELSISYCPYCGAHLETLSLEQVVLDAARRWYTLDSTTGHVCGDEEPLRDAVKQLLDAESVV